MSKYDAIAEFLLSENKNEIRLQFIDLEKEIGFSLPASARKYPEWWANNESEARHCNSWMNAGWLTCDVDIEGEKVTFTKANSTFRISSNVKSEKTSLKQIKAKVTEQVIAPDGAIKLEMGMCWLELGQITIDEYGKLVFPIPEKLPGLYRLRLQSRDKDMRYIGETVNLQRRFAHYRNPGPTQKTNIRINAALIEHISYGNTVMVDTVIDASTLHFDGHKIVPTFSEKATRRLFEHAAIVFDSVSSIKSLNL